MEGGEASINQTVELGGEDTGKPGADAEQGQKENEQADEEAGRASLLDEVGVLYFVAKARDAFRASR